MGGGSSLGVEYQVVKRGRDYHGSGENIMRIKKGKGDAILLFPLILRLLGRLLGREEEKAYLLRRKKQDLKKGMGKNIKL